MIKILTYLLSERINLIGNNYKIVFTFVDNCSCLFFSLFFSEVYLPLCLVIWPYFCQNYVIFGTFFDGLVEAKIFLFSSWLLICGYFIVKSDLEVVYWYQ